VHRVQERGTVAPVTRRRAVALGGIAAAVIAADQVTKTWAERALVDGPRHLFWTVQLNLTYNSGAAFSSARGLTPFITAFAVAVLIALVGVSRSVRTTMGVVAMGLVIGGASGNLVDRLVRHNRGSVIDFIDFQWWPVWNIADACIVIGAALLIIGSRASSEADGP
jgi:signal peptidase II